MVSLNSGMKTTLLRFAFGFAVLATASGWASCSAQSSATTRPEDVHGVKIREIHPKDTPTPFPLDARTGRVEELEFRSPEQMTSADRELAEANEAEIARRAGLQGFNLRQADTAEGGWGYEQAVCPAFPEQLILEYSRIEARGDVSLFSVAIPRDGEGHVRLIPARRRGYSLWTPASSNALTLNDFNHMVKEAPSGLSPDWLTVGLCYAALAGGHVRAALVPQTAAEQVFPLFVPAKLSVSGKGGAEVQITNVTPGQKAMDWRFTFAQNGRLLKVKHVVSGEILERPLRPTVAEKSVPVKGTALDLNKAGN